MLFQSKANSSPVNSWIGREGGYNYVNENWFQLVVYVVYVVVEFGGSGFTCMLRLQVEIYLLCK